MHTQAPSGSDRQGLPGQQRVPLPDFNTANGAFGLKICCLKSKSFKFQIRFLVSGVHYSTINSYLYFIVQC